MRALTFAVATALVLTTSPAVPASADTTPRLPAPTGRHPVGTTSLYLEDTSRPDPWVPSVAARELMVSLFYPAASARGPKKQYMTPVESSAVLEEAGLTTVPPDALAAVRTNAVVDARPLPGRKHSRPLVVLSPGFKRPRATLSTLAEDLASHGYVVVVVDHTYENVATTFPDGRVAPCAACGNHDPEFWSALERGRATDVSFVLDQLTGPLRHRPGADLVDPSRIAMGGHSVGGASSLAALRADPRILAAIDVDGSISTPVPETGMSRPVMLLGRRSAYAPGTGGSAKSWEDAWPLLTGWRRWLVVDGMVHPSFTDLGVLAGQLGVDLGAAVGGERGAAITRAHVRAFFDLHLRGVPQPLLDGPSPDSTSSSATRRRPPWVMLR
ncbi:alpha/beta hydrolase [Actinosynnema sp. NPDC023658]|uniref:alpha/beta hydrolase family protein n=1 Tax=Actinosynnema sp. NPDC023658 TaxID=3155465 RepID=UPI0033F45C10